MDGASATPSSTPADPAVYPTAVDTDSASADGSAMTPDGTRSGLLGVLHEDKLAATTSENAAARTLVLSSDEDDGDNDNDNDNDDDCDEEDGPDCAPGAGVGENGSRWRRRRRRQQQGTPSRKKLRLERGKQASSMDRKDPPMNTRSCDQGAREGDDDRGSVLDMSDCTTAPGPLLSESVQASAALIAKQLVARETVAMRAVQKLVDDSHDDSRDGVALAGLDSGSSSDSDSNAASKDRRASAKSGAVPEGAMRSPPVAAASVSKEDDPRNIGRGFHFATDHLQLRTNADYVLLLRTLVTLQAQRLQVLEDLDRLYELRRQARARPMEFLNVLKRRRRAEAQGTQLGSLNAPAGQGPDEWVFPARQQVAPVPAIDFASYQHSQYGVSLRNATRLEGRQLRLAISASEKDQSPASHGPSRQESTPSVAAATPAAGPAATIAVTPLSAMHRMLSDSLQSPSAVANPPSAATPVKKSKASLKSSLAMDNSVDPALKSTVQLYSTIAITAITSAASREDGRSGSALTAVAAAAKLVKPAADSSGEALEAAASDTSRNNGDGASKKPKGDSDDADEAATPLAASTVASALASASQSAATSADEDEQPLGRRATRRSMQRPPVSDRKTPREERSGDSAEESTGPSTTATTTATTTAANDDRDAEDDGDGGDLTGPPSPVSATLHLPWSLEEQAVLDRLLVVYPSYECQNETERFARIATAMGTRTTKQIASRVQKYAIKLNKLGRKLPGTAPPPPSALTGISESEALQAAIEKAIEGGIIVYASATRYPSRAKPSKKSALTRKSTPTQQSTPEPPAPAEPPSSRARSKSRAKKVNAVFSAPKVLMPEDDSNDGMADETVDKDLMETEEYKELVRLKWLKLQQQQQQQQGMRPRKQNAVVHDDFQCDGCGMDPIVGVRWKCIECVAEGNQIDLCEACYQSHWNNDDHFPFHQMERIAHPDQLGLHDFDYLQTFRDEYSYLDSNFFSGSHL